MAASGKIILITGGSRSGKSEFAEKLARSIGKSCAYIATAMVEDEEMRARVIRHRERRRDEFWVNYEAPLAAYKLMRELGGEESVLFDCLTIYITNLLYARPTADKQSVLDKELALLLAAARQTGKTVLFVTNEVGSGIVPFDAEVREFRDLAGQANQIMAAAADEVYLVVSGLAVEIKSLAVRLRDRGSCQ